MGTRLLDDERPVIAAAPAVVSHVDGYAIYHVQDFGARKPLLRHEPRSYRIAICAAGMWNLPPSRLQVQHRLLAEGRGGVTDSVVIVDFSVTRRRLKESPTASSSRTSP